MANEAKCVKGLGRTCAECYIKPGNQEDCVEVNGKVYHTHHNPLRKKEVIRTSGQPNQLAFAFRA